MKMIKHFIPVVVVFVLVVGLLVHANSKHGSRISDEIQSLEEALVQARSQEVSPTRKITDRRAFREGVFFAQKVIGNIRNEGALLSLRARRDRKEILRGLDGVEVLVEGLQPNAERYGITQQLLQTDTELHLRMHGIKVGTDVQTQDEKLDDQAITNAIVQYWRQATNAKSDQDFLQAARKWIRRDFFETYQLYGQLPVLYINLNIVVDEVMQHAAFSIRVELQEGAYLCRNGALFCDVPVWKKGVGLGTCSPSDLKDYVRECLRDIINEFINDYLAANPKERSSQNEQ